MEQVDLMIINGYVVTQNDQGDEYADGAIAIKEREIAAVGPTHEITARYQAEQTIDARDRCIFPGFINTHTHLFQSFLKGLGEGIHVHSWIRAITVPGIMHMTDRDFYLSAMIGCLDAIRSGTTTLVEYMYPNPWHEMGDIILQALTDAGMRALLGRGIADIADYENFPAATWIPEMTEPLPEAMDDCARLLKACDERGEGRIGFCLAPVHMRCVKPETLGIMQDFARNNECIISMHICETPRDDEIIGERHGRLAVQWLDEIGFLDANLLAVHCVNLVDDAIRRFAAYDVKVSYNPVSNMYVATGVAPIPQLLEQDVTVSLATDGAASNNAQDILECMKSGVLLQRAATRTPNILSGRDALRMATMDGARALGKADLIGSLEQGKRADLVITDFLQPKSAPYYDPINTLVFSSSPRVVNTVIIDGRVILEEGRFTVIDEDALIHEAQTAGHNLARRSYSSEILQTARAIKPTGK